MKNSIMSFQNRVSFLGSASVVGRREYEGALGELFDLHDSTDKFGMNTWEKAESEMQRLAINTALAKVSATEREIDAIFAGDLLNQCVGSSYGLLGFDIPYFGLYGACSTAAESIILAAALVDSDHISSAAAVTSSHNCTAERQFRTPIEYGGQRSPTSQWTVTGAGAFLIGKGGNAIIKEALPGIVVEKGIKDLSNMGAAMAPAAADTIIRYFKAASLSPRDFDAIVTGDLGIEGGKILCELLLTEGIDIRQNFLDCGIMIYGGGDYELYPESAVFKGKSCRKKRDFDLNAGGSGCGCSATVLSAYFLPKLKSGELKNILFLGTGAMMSPASVQQGQSIPAIAHLVRLTHED